VADLSLYVRQTPLASVERAVEQWQVEHDRRLPVNVEEADDFPGFSVVVDIDLSDETELRSIITDLAERIGDAVPEWEISLTSA
jgi:hypothetical protein